MSKPTLPLSKQVSYAIGQLGWSILINIIGFWQVYMYLPPCEAGFPDLISKIAFLGISTIGLVSAIGRLWDGVTDPLIANMSDRWQSKWGRRIPFLAVGALPAAIFCALVFLPPNKSITGMNLFWMSGAMLLFYLFLTVYVTPYFAMIPELGHTATERLNISTYISVTYAMGIIIASQVPKFAEILQTTFTLEKYQSFQWAIALLCVLACFCMVFPVFAINEKTYCESIPSTVPFKEAILMTFKNKDFVYFAFSDFNYFLAMNILTTGITYYVTVLLSLKESIVSDILPVMLIASIICYPIVNFFARKVGKKRVVMFGFTIFLLLFVFIYFMGSPAIPLAPIAQAYLIVIVAGIPMAILGILPNAILADIVELDALKTGSRREGLFYAARTLMQKLGQTVGVLLFSSLLLIGTAERASNDTNQELSSTKTTTSSCEKTSENNGRFGVQITGPVAAGFCFLAIVFFGRYREKETIEEIEKNYKA